MKLCPIGVSNEADAKRFMRAEDFSDCRYDGVQLRTDRKKNPVIIMESKRTDPLRWKVVYGFSQVFFRLHTRKPASFEDTLSSLSTAKTASGS